MSEQTPDVSKVVRLIMENPSIIEEISALMKSDAKEEPQTSPAPEAEPTAITEVQSTTPVVTEPKTLPHAKNRSELLCAMKPYVSAERAKAIDSMISIMGILEMMRGG